VSALGAFGRGGKLVVRDLDGDGRLDIVVGQLDTSRRTIWFRNAPEGWQSHLLSQDSYCHEENTQVIGRTAPSSPGGT